MAERDLEEWFVERVRQLGGYAVKFSPMGIRGFPDRIVLLPGGKIGFAELKNPNGKGRVSSAQVRAAHTLRRLGFNVIISHEKKELNDWVEKLHAA